MEFKECFMPYCLQRLKDGRYIVLNRQYKPLGTFSGEWVDYETHPSACKLDIDSKTALSLSCLNSDNLDRIQIWWIDGQGTTGTKADARVYLKRLELLMHLSVG